ncbi:hypothetical protein T11_6115, partial [Trichinella zimbabwensis]
MPSIASLMAFSLLKVTNPKPLDLPVSRSLMIFDSMISPKGAKALSSASLSVAQASPPTKQRNSISA